MTNSFVTYSGHQIGVSHINKGLSCEDYSANYIDDNIAIAVISDGHGDKNCFRSARGAEVACDVSVRVIKNYFSDYEIASSQLKNSPDRMITEIEKTIIELWNESVLDEVHRNPFTEEELAGLEESVVEVLKSGQREQKVFGCTLIMCVFLKDFWFGIHIGDGKCVVIRSNGLYEQPIPWDNEGCVGNRSTSICSSTAIQSFRHYYSNEVPVAVFVASDGIDESFDDNGLNKCYFSVTSWVRQLSTDECNQKMKELLGKISQGGSGDDVSIACIINKTAEIKKPYATSHQVAEKMEELLGMLKESEARYAELLESYRNSTEATKKFEDEINKIKNDLKQKEEALEDKKCESQSLQKNLNSIKEQFVQLSSQFSNAKETKMKVDEYWRQQGIEICDNTETMSYIPMKVDDDEAEEGIRGDIVLEQPLIVGEEKSNGEETMDNTRLFANNTPEKCPTVEVVSSSDGEVRGNRVILEEKQQPETKKPGFLGSLFKK